MIIKSIKLENFRNYESLELSFEKGTNILYGDNAQGKTNVLEAVYLSATTKSHKGSKDKEMIRFGQEESHIRTNLDKEGMEYRVDMHLKKSKSKGIAVNGTAFKESSTAAWSFKCGIFLAGGSFHYKERSFREKKIC